MPKPPPPPAADAAAVTVPLDGMAMIPDGSLGAVITFLEMRARPEGLPAAAPDLAFERLGGDEVARFRRLFREVGEDWMWTSRLPWTDAEVSARLAEPGIEALAIRRDGADIGLVELDGRTTGEIEVVLCGLAPGAVGRGAGKAALAAVLGDAWSRPGTRRVWLHTCTLDHPRALGFYRSMGFVAFARAIEISPDPRLKGLMRREAAPDLPVVG